jgi:hypothetical protein
VRTETDQGGCRKRKDRRNQPEAPSIRRWVCRATVHLVRPFAWCLLAGDRRSSAEGKAMMSGHPAFVMNTWSI